MGSCGILFKAAENGERSQDFPFLDSAGCLVEIHADFKDPAAVIGKRFGVAFLLNLCQGLVGAAVGLDLDDVDVAFGLQ